MNISYMLTTKDVAAELGVSYSYANKVVKALNEELAGKGYMVVTGKVSRKFFEERFYGMNTTANQQKGDQ